MAKIRAVETIPGKLWITYDQAGTKTGTLTHGLDGYSWLRTAMPPAQLSDSEVTLAFDLQEKAELSTWHQEHVLGYPVPKIETFKVQIKEDTLPCFTKTPNSKVFFAAGYYGINFDNGGWLESHCPKLATLRKYEHIGPFKTETDMQIAIQRKKRSYE